MDVTTDLSPAERVLSRFEFIAESPGVGSCLFVALILASLVGAFGNLLILVALCKSKKMNSLECIFIGNLALSDLYVTIVADPMNIVGKYAAFQLLDRPIFCIEWQSFYPVISISEIEFNCNYYLGLITCTPINK